ncbi:hypothetical protein RUND412_005364 [Rhizina undulata]
METPEIQPANYLPSIVTIFSAEPTEHSTNRIPHDPSVPYTSGNEPLPPQLSRLPLPPPSKIVTKAINDANNTTLLENQRILQEKLVSFNDFAKESQRRMREAEEGYEFLDSRERETWDPRSYPAETFRRRMTRASATIQDGELVDLQQVGGSELPSSLSPPPSGTLSINIMLKKRETTAKGSQRKSAGVQKKAGRVGGKTGKTGKTENPASKKTGKPVIGKPVGRVVGKTVGNKTKKNGPGRKSGKKAK